MNRKMIFNKIQYLIMMMIILLLSMTSCKEETAEVIEEPYLILVTDGAAPKSLSVGTYAFERMFNVRSNASWSIVARESDSWLTISPKQGEKNGYFNLNIEKNRTGAERTTELSIVMNGKELSKFPITQQEFAPAIAVAIKPKTGKIDDIGGEMAFTVAANGDEWTYSVADGDWLSEVIRTPNSLKLKAGTNVFADRTAIVTFSFYSESQDVEITQPTLLPSLPERTILNLEVVDGTDGVINWNAAAVSLLNTHTEVRYTMSNGTKKTLKIPSSQTSTLCSDIKRGEFVEYRSVFYARTLADTLFLDWTLSETPFMNKVAKNGWSVEAFSSNHGGDNVVAHAIDGNTTNRWHSQDDPRPHFITISMGAEVNIARFGIWPSVFDTGGSADARMPHKIRFEVSMDNANWTSVGEFAYDNSTTNLSERFFNITPVAAKYFRLTAVEWTQNPMVLGELDVFEL
ncbi:MAG: discoidin domain-containing protein [Prevotellaceae bacterium]|jgi:hypothetical protein|nr:discoidin domain-containing protein [Prevotellaceae bacterium]